MVALCVRYLGRHPLELGALPGRALEDLEALNAIETEARR